MGRTKYYYETENESIQQTICPLCNKWFGSMNLTEPSDKRLMLQMKLHYKQAHKLKFNEREYKNTKGNWEARVVTEEGKPLSKVTIIDEDTLTITHKWGNAISYVIKK